MDSDKSSVNEMENVENILPNAAIPKAERKKKMSTEYLVLSAIADLNEKKGSSLVAIRKYVIAKQPSFDKKNLNLYMKKCIKKAVAEQRLIQTSGVGATGSFKLNPKFKHSMRQPIVQRVKTVGKKIVKKATKEMPEKAVEQKKTSEVLETSADANDDYGPSTSKAAKLKQKESKSNQKQPSQAKDEEVLETSADENDDYVPSTSKAAKLKQKEAKSNQKQPSQAKDEEVLETSADANVDYLPSTSKATKLKQKEAKTNQKQPLQAKNKPEVAQKVVKNKPKDANKNEEIEPKANVVKADVRKRKLLPMPEEVPMVPQKMATKVPSPPVAAESTQKMATKVPSPPVAAESTPAATRKKQGVADKKPASAVAGVFENVEIKTKKKVVQQKRNAAGKKINQQNDI